MSDTAIVGRNVEVVQTRINDGNTAFSWSAAFAGALAATAITFVVLALGSGIGLSFASPYASGPSLGTLGVMAAVWLVMAQIFGFAAGGYFAARLRSHAYRAEEDGTFRDAAQGFGVWAIVVCATVFLAAVTAGGAASTVAQIGAVAGVRGAPASNIAGRGGADQLRGRAEYYTDQLLRGNPMTVRREQRPTSEQTSQTPASPQQPQVPGSGTTALSGSSPTAGTPQGETPPSMMATTNQGQPQQTSSQRFDTYRTETGRIVTTYLTSGQIPDEDKTYLSRMIAARTGLTEAEAAKRVDDVTNEIGRTTKDAADKAARAGAAASFWAFMSLLCGAVAAALGGMCGGELRDRHIDRVAPRNP